MTTRGRVVIVSIVFTILVTLASLVISIVYKSNSEWSKIFFAVVMGICLMFATSWVLYFKSNSGSLFVISIYPGITIMPLLLIYQDLASRLSLGIGQQVAIFIAIGIIFVATYLLLLTANILNGYQLFGIPLGMAGKATQFVTNLIAIYILTTYLFSINEFNYVKLILVSVYAFINVFILLWCTWENKSEVLKFTLINSLILLILSAILTVWPLRPVWAGLLITIVQYLTLNTALDLKEKVNRLVLIEYITLALICLFVLLVNAEWGINGLLI